MPRKKSATLTQAELRIMEVLWNKGSATVAEVSAGLPPPPIAYNTVLTMLRILERKGYVRHKEAGRAFVYRTAVKREDAAQSAVGDLIKRFFRKDPSELVLRLIEHEHPSEDELARLRSMIEKYQDRE